MFWTKSKLARQSSITSNDMSIDVDQRAPETLVNVAGRVTVNSSPRLRSMLLRLIGTSTNDAVIVNLAGVEVLDTSGMATLLEALDMAQKRSVKLRLIGVNGQPRTLAEMMELSTIFAAAGSEVVLT